MNHSEDARADRMVPLAEVLVTAVREHEPGVVRQVWDATDRPALMVVLAAMVADARDDGDEAKHEMRGIKPAGMTARKVWELALAAEAKRREAA